MATSQTTPVTGEMIAKKRIFNLDNFQKETVEVKYSPRQLATVQDLQQLNAETLLKAANLYLKKTAAKEAKASVGGASPAVVNKFVAVFKLVPRFAEMVPAENSTPEQRKAQRDAIYAFMKSQPGIIDSIRETAGVDDEDEGEDEDNDV